MDSFETYQVAPEQPTSLANRQSIPLPACHLDPELVVNSFTVPRPFDVDRLRSALARTLQLFPLHCGVVARDGDSWSIKLVNEPVHLTVGSTDEPGPFADSWDGKLHADYYEELDCEAICGGSGTPLFLARVTTWARTGQTALFCCAWHGLGDALASMHLAKTWSAIYQNKAPPDPPTFSKFLLPEPQMQTISSYGFERERLSYLSVDVDPGFYDSRKRQMDDEALRLDIDLPGTFVDQLWALVKESPEMNGSIVGRADAFSGYLIAALQDCFEAPVETLYQLVSLRGRTAVYNGKDVSFPYSTQGNAFILWPTPVTTPRSEQTPGTFAQNLYRGRSELSNKNRLGRAIMLADYLWARAEFKSPNRRSAGLNDADFGFPLQSGHIDWDATEKFIQVWKANPLEQDDGSWIRDPRGLHVLLRLKPEHAFGFLERLRLDMDRLSLDQRYPSSPAAIARRIRESVSHDARQGGMEKTKSLL
ncbi:Chloramphenicol acetyltransferase-like domain protein [Metarhizium rileyi]|uniref:Chloramphenicol acetyltransferase-like domain protein n=1 Tax=Metarhizium rileyi (strain RCEF 4871) TaxID=1649241 RepID=A0A162J8I0_METRR|nr:Chloramphenicol acetyltransferase-like domain protein [Metarhizium rileyi RCEF 4871]